MKIKLELLLLVCIGFKLLGVVLFLQGFFAVRKSVEGHATFADQPSNPLTETEMDTKQTEVRDDPSFGRLVVILIDALRADFVLPVESNLPRMKFVENLINQKETISFKAKANPPTVTLPRIKALTSGSIPGFVDVVLNFDSKSLRDDNIVTQFHRDGKKIVFYGDDTWIRLFPEHFIRSEGTTSFFVTDYTEVDYNITRHLDEELTANDWDVLILHYLGLDHIGHLAGPLSRLVPVKLKEMDDIVKYIYEAVVKQDSSRKSPTLLLLCGDHGMSEQGSHGGSSPSEVTTPVVLMSSAFGRGKGSGFQSETEVQQIDVTPTLSALLGVPIPQNSLGVVIPQTLRSLPMSRQLGMLHANAQQLSEVFKKNVPNYEKDDLYNGSFKRAVKMHANWLEHFYAKNKNIKVEDLGQKVKEHYIKVMTAMRDRIAASLTKYDLHSMGVAVSLLWMVLLCLAYGYAQRHEVYFDISLGLHGSFVLMLMVGLLSAAHLRECTGKGKTGSQLLCRNDYITYAIVLAILYGSSLFCSVTLIKASKLTSGLSLPNPRTLTSAFLAVGTFIHTLTLLASSFVEEEHQTWYFFTMTSLILMIVHSLYKYNQQCKVLQRQRELQKTRELNFNHFANQKSISNMHCDLYQQAFKPNREPNCKVPLSGSTESEATVLRQTAGRPNVTTSVDSSKVATEKEPLESPSLEPVIPLLMVLVLCRVCRMWNQTGDKWSHLPDVGDLLVEPENKLFLSVISALALLFTVMSRSVENSKSTNVLLFTGCVAVYCFRAANGALVLPILYESSELSKGILEARIVYAIVCIMFLDTILKYFQRKNERSHDSSKRKEKEILETRSVQDVPFHGIQNIWILLMFLLMRPHNISLVAMISLQELCLRVYLKKMQDSFSTASITLLYLWMGQAAFYYQGNSNNISTVDVSAGYIGLEDYQPVLIGILMALSTYSGPIFWTISLLKTLMEGVKAERAHEVHSREDLAAQSKSSQRITPKPEQTEKCLSNVKVDSPNKHGEDVSKKFSSDILEVCFILVITRALPLAVYTILVSGQRYHLFVWTVFSPKLLYEGMHTLVVTILVLVLLAVRALFARCLLSYLS